MTSKTIASRLGGMCPPPPRSYATEFRENSYVEITAMGITTNWPVTYQLIKVSLESKVERILFCSEEENIDGWAYQT